MDQSSFSAFLEEKIKERGLTLKKLSELSGVPLIHLETLVTGNRKTLPPFPYVKGYLERIAPIVDIDPGILLEELKKTGEFIRSGPSDQMPMNRFRLEPLARYLPFLIILLIIAIYVVIRFSAIVGRPGLVILEPQESTTRTSERFISLRGELKSATELSVNGETVPVNSEGRWEIRISLEPGINTIEVKAKKFLGQETTLLRQVLYEPPEESIEPSPSLDTLVP